MNQTKIEVYQDEDPLGSGKWYGYLSNGNVAYGNVGPFDTEAEAREALS